MRTPETLLREENPTDGLEEAVAAFRYHALGKRARDRRWPAAAVLAASFALGGTMLRLSATPAEASPLAGIAQAERDAPRCTLTVLNGYGKPWLRAWQDGKRHAMQADLTGPQGTAWGNDGRRSWIVMRSANLAVVQSGGESHDIPLQRIEDYRGKVVLITKDDDGTKTVVVERVASPTSLRQRDTIITDALDRPISVTHEFQRGGLWTLQGRELRDYDSPIATEKFAFRPPKGFEVYDVDLNRARLRDGLRSGPSRERSGTVVRLLGVLQERSGWVTAVYTGGTTPLPDAVSYAERGGRRYSGHVLVGYFFDARPSRAIRSATPQRSADLSDAIHVSATPKPYASLGGQPIRVIRFDLPKLMGNPARPLRIVLPVVTEGPPRSVHNDPWLVQGLGKSLGTATFDSISPIPSNRAEEVYNLPDAPKGSYVIGLRDR